MATALTLNQYMDHIGDVRARKWVYKTEQERGVFVPRQLMALCGGNAADAILLAQIIYWSGVSGETPRARIRHRRKQELWIVKQHQEWAEETGLSAETVKNALNRLGDRELIVKETGLSPMHENCNGSPTRALHVRLNWSVFLDEVDRVHGEKGQIPVLKRAKCTFPKRTIHPRLTQRVRQRVLQKLIEFLTNRTTIGALPLILRRSRIPLVQA